MICNVFGGIRLLLALTEHFHNLGRQIHILLYRKLGLSGGAVFVKSSALNILSKLENKCSFSNICGTSLYMIPSSSNPKVSLLHFKRSILIHMRPHLKLRQLAPLFFLLAASLCIDCVVQSSISTVIVNVLYSEVCSPEFCRRSEALVGGDILESNIQQMNEEAPITINVIFIRQYLINRLMSAKQNANVNASNFHSHILASDICQSLQWNIYSSEEFCEPFRVTFKNNTKGISQLRQVSFAHVR